MLLDQTPSRSIAGTTNKDIEDVQGLYGIGKMPDRQKSQSHGTVKYTFKEKQPVKRGVAGEIQNTFDAAAVDSNEVDSRPQK